LLCRAKLAVRRAIKEECLLEAEFEWTMGNRL
jgi:hypothetical protein